MNLKQAAEELSLFARGYAPVVNMAVITVCNQRCIICRCWHMCWQKETETLTLEEINGLVCQLVKDLHVKRFRITSTDPLLRSDLPDIIRCIRRYSGCSLITNGMAMTSEMAHELIRAGVSKVRFSIDAPNDVNDKIRGIEGAWRRSKEGVQTLLHAREESGSLYPKIEIYSVLTTLNIEYIPDVFRFARDLDLDGLTFGIVWENTQEAVNRTVWRAKVVARNHMVPQRTSIKPSRLQVARLREQLVRAGFISKRSEHTKRSVERLLGALERRGESYRCPYHYFVNIDPAGNFIPCPVMGNYSFGNIRAKSARSIWFSLEHHEFLAQIARTPFPVCLETCKAKDELYVASLKSEMRGVVMSLLYYINMQSLRRSATRKTGT